MTPSAALDLLLKRDRAAVAAGLVGVAALSWVYLVVLSAEMPDMPEAMTAMRMKPWGMAELVLMFLMWAVMMVGMMVPSAAPMILTCVAKTFLNRVGLRDINLFNLN